MAQKTDSDNVGIPHFIDDASECLILLPQSNRKALEWLAVLGAAGVKYDLTKGEGQWRIIVAETNRALAMRQINEYEQECSYWPPKFDLDYIGPSGINIPSFYVAIFLVCFFLVTGPYDANVIWFQQGQGDTEKMLSGEFWRAATALTLHSDFSHIFGNALCCIFLCGAVCQSLGNGVGWLLILLSGVSANTINSLIHQPLYRYVGASTAIFAALGILGMLQSIRLYRNSNVYTYRFYLPLISVFAILSVLGTGPKADILGHFMGVICGVFCGVMGAFLKKYHRHTMLQVCCLIVVIFITLLSWGVALD